MMNKSEQGTSASRFAAVVGLGLAVAAAACSNGVNSATSPSGVSPSSLAATGQNSGQDARDFSVTLAPTSVSVGAATLHVTVTRNATSGQSQKLGSVEIYVPSGLAIQSVSIVSNANWTHGVSGQTVRVGALSGNHKLNATTNSVTFDINVTSAVCGTYEFDAKAANSTYAETFEPNWTRAAGVLSVTVTDCVVEECKAAPAVANEYLDGIGFSGGGKDGLKRGDIISLVAQHMTQGARFDDVEPCDVEAYRARVVAFVDALLAE